MFFTNCIILLSKMSVRLMKVTCMQSYRSRSECAITSAVQVFLGCRWT